MSSAVVLCLDLWHRSRLERTTVLNHFWISKSYRSGKYLNNSHFFISSCSLSKNLESSRKMHNCSLHLFSWSIISIVKIFCIFHCCLFPFAGCAGTSGIGHGTAQESNGISAYGKHCANCQCAGNCFNSAQRSHFHGEISAKIVTKTNHCRMNNANCHFVLKIPTHKIFQNSIFQLNQMLFTLKYLLFYFLYHFKLDSKSKQRQLTLVLWVRPQQQGME